RAAGCVRSIACASVRTLIASTARAEEAPRASTISIALTQARTSCNRRPPSSTPVDPPAGLSPERLNVQASELYVDLRRFRGPRGLRKDAKVPARESPEQQQTPNDFRAL